MEVKKASGFYGELANFSDGTLAAFVLIPTKVEEEIFKGKIRLNIENHEVVFEYSFLLNPKMAYPRFLVKEPFEDNMYLAIFFVKHFSYEKNKEQLYHDLKNYFLDFFRKNKDIAESEFNKIVNNTMDIILKKNDELVDKREKIYKEFEGEKTFNEMKDLLKKYKITKEPSGIGIILTKNNKYKFICYRYKNNREFSAAISIQNFLNNNEENVKKELIKKMRRAGLMENFYNSFINFKEFLLSEIKETEVFSGTFEEVTNFAIKNIKRKDLRIVFGTRFNKWYVINKNDRDFDYAIPLDKFI